MLFVQGFIWRLASGQSTVFFSPLSPYTNSLRCFAEKDPASECGEGKNGNGQYLRPLVLFRGQIRLPAFSAFVAGILKRADVEIEADKIADRDE